MPGPSTSYLLTHLLFYLVVLGEGRDEDHGVAVVEGVNPLAPLVALPAHVEHREVYSLDLEVRLVVNSKQQVEY